MAKANKPTDVEITQLPRAALPEARLDLKSGVEIIAQFHKTLPNRPGVYRMIGEIGNVLYVGKAKSLKKRVATYARGIGHTNQITRMLGMVRGMEFTITHTEAEALLLEANLIRRLKPRYNVLMRDDKSFPFIAIGLDHPSPYLVKHRGPRQKGIDYFGPFANGFSLAKSLNILQKAFLLRSCSNAEFEGRSRPCMQYQIKRCSAPCCGLIAPEEYRELVDQARLFMRGRSNKLQDDLAKEMQVASNALDYERAATLRDRIRALAGIRDGQGLNPQGFSQADAFAIACDGGVSCIEVFFFRAGQNWGNRAYYPRHEKGLSESEILASFIGQFYQTNAPPDLILLSHEIDETGLLEEALGTLAGSKISLQVPKKGEKRDIILSILNNAKQTLARKLSESGAIAKLLDEVALRFELEERPNRIEVYDNSHIQGTNAVGAMIVAGPDGFIKNQYRKWTIKDAKGGDDSHMMREVLTRRFSRLNDIDTSDDDLSPDLIIIDGGQIQLSVALEVARELGVVENIKIIAMSKGVDRNAGREEFHEVGKKPYRMPANDPVLYYLQRLRDESHRFVIGAHRAKRSAAAVKNPLSMIEGIGPLRKKALMGRFGSAKAVSTASIRDLAATPHVSEEIAKRIYDYFQDNQ
ncbi:MAG: excinuclease ABC subunit C [Hyphomonadaceae bacterium]|nr:MAG: excinuclease ABC subunit C [Hyphomonadaceae bacterium]